MSGTDGFGCVIKPFWIKPIGAWHSAANPAQWVLRPLLFHHERKVIIWMLVLNGDVYYTTFSLKLY